MKFLDLLFPPRCLSCRAFLCDSPALCPSCEGKWPTLRPPCCTVCSYPFPSLEPGEVESHRCGDCLKRERVCQRLFAAGLYQGILLELIVRMKYRGEERLAAHLGQRMAEATQVKDYDLIVPIPLHRRRLRERGFNQALLLAREVGRALNIAVDPFFVVKQRETTPQAVLRGEERRRSLEGVFKIPRPEKVQDKKVLLVDDVYTTGATIEEASRVLLKAGAKKVEALILARAV